jgi:hypothetical protein
MRMEPKTRDFVGAGVLALVLLVLVLLLVTAALPG